MVPQWEEVRLPPPDKPDPSPHSSWASPSHRSAVNKNVEGFTPHFRQFENVVNANLVINE